MNEIEQIEMLNKTDESQFVNRPGNILINSLLISIIWVLNIILIHADSMEMSAKEHSKERDKAKVFPWKVISIQWQQKNKYNSIYYRIPSELAER